MTLHARHLANRYRAAERIVIGIEAARKAGVQLSIEDVRNASAKTQQLVGEITGMKSAPSFATWQLVLELLEQAERDPFAGLTDKMPRHLRAV